MSASNPVELAAEIVAAFVSYNPVPKSEGATCPVCPFWAGRDRWAGKRLQ
jgi:hypothetical protein